jgi:hypothetical protein
MDHFCILQIVSIGLADTWYTLSTDTKNDFCSSDVSPSSISGFLSTAIFNCCQIACMEGQYSIPFLLLSRAAAGELHDWVLRARKDRTWQQPATFVAPLPPSSCSRSRIKIWWYHNAHTLDAVRCRCTNIISMAQRCWSGEWSASSTVPMPTRNAVRVYVAN